MCFQVFTLSVMSVTELMCCVRGLPQFTSPIFFKPWNTIYFKTVFWGCCQTRGFKDMICEIYALKCLKTTRHFFFSCVLTFRAEMITWVNRTISLWKIRAAKKFAMGCERTRGRKKSQKSQKVWDHFKLKRKENSLESNYCKVKVASFSASVSTGKSMGAKLCQQ